MTTYQELVATALEKARVKHGPMINLHEAYAVILEEVDEFWAEVKHQNPITPSLLEELVHISAMCQRAAEDLGLIMLAPGNVTQLARQVRLAITQDQYGQGNLTLAQALDILSGPLSPDDPASVFDDSALLQLKAEDQPHA